MCPQDERFGDGKEIEVLYDGDCPLCDREVRMLRRMDRKQRIRFTNIAAAEFEAGDYGLTQDAVMAEIHARLPDGSWIRGVEVFRRIYSALGWGPVVRLTRLPVVSNLLDGAYRLFTRNRLRMTGRCAAESVACQLER
jgi:predicted DCC family thiol-disulfide oxidoreductase YuxK